MNTIFSLFSFLAFGLATTLSYAYARQYPKNRKAFYTLFVITLTGLIISTINLIQNLVFIN